MAKKKYSFYIEESVMKDFRETTDRIGLVQGKIIENFMKEVTEQYLEGEGNEKTSKAKI